MKDKTKLETIVSKDERGNKTSTQQLERPMNQPDSDKYLEDQVETLGELDMVKTHALFRTINTVQGDLYTWYITNVAPKTGLFLLTENIIAKFPKTLASSKDAPKGSFLYDIMKEVRWLRKTLGKRTEKLGISPEALKNLREYERYTGLDREINIDPETGEQIDKENGYVSEIQRVHEPASRLMFDRHIIMASCPERAAEIQTKMYETEAKKARDKKDRYSEIYFTRLANAVKSAHEQFRKAPSDSIERLGHDMQGENGANAEYAAVRAKYTGQEGGSARSHHAVTASSVQHQAAPAHKN
ncbi:MAG: hypothetical protein GY861_14805 [bacterium]|nr:hypothetical protein [bacterium]